MGKIKRFRSRKKHSSLTPSFWDGVAQAVDLQGETTVEDVVRMKYMRTKPVRVRSRFKIVTVKSAIETDVRKIGRDLSNSVEKVVSRKPELKGLGDGRRLAGS